MRTWNELSMTEKADVMKLAVEGGVYDLNSIRSGYNEYAKGGKIHIDPSKKGTFTAAASRHGKSVQTFASQVLAHPENYSPAMRKKANFARNAAKWKHAYGGELGNYYDGLGDAWNFLKTSVQKVNQKVKDWGLDKSPGEHLARLFTSDDTKQLQQTQQKETLTYRNRPAERRTIITPSGKYTQVVPIRQRRNNSPTGKESESYENAMRSMVMSRQNVNGGSNPEYDIPYIPEKKILINGNYTSTNVLDSLAKYAGIHNRNPQLSQYPIHERSYYKEPRKLDKEEWLGLSTRETKNGAQPYFNQDKDDHYNRVIGNSNYFTAFGYIPADNLMRNYQYTDANVDKLTPPILDAFRYYAQGDYNAKRDKHKRNVIKEGEAVWNNPEVKKWWELSGKYWYNNGREPED